MAYSDFPRSAVAPGKIFLFKESQAGFSVLEALVAASILSIVFLALSSLALGMVRGNRISQKSLEATVLAQSTIESLRYTGFKLDTDGTITSTMTPATHPFRNSSSSNDAEMDEATLFANPDHAFTWSSGIESLPVLDSPSLTPETKLRRAWVIRDNVPVSGMKTVTVVIGWDENGNDHYVSVSSAMQGQ